MTAQVPDRFEILDTLASTDDEALLRARDSVLAREVVLKVPGAGAARAFAADTQRELREARMLARVRHPGVMHLHEVIQTDAGPILVIDPIAGEPLAAVLAREGKLESDRVRTIGREVAAALDAVHRAGVVHRGVATDSIFVRGDGSTVLAGFLFAKPGSGQGLSSLNYGASNAPDATSLPRHPAPEQLAGHAADARADIYGLGCVLFELLTGEGMTQDARDPRAHADVPRDLAEVVIRCTAPSPLGRFQDAGTLGVALEGKSESVRAPRRAVLLALGGTGIAAAAALVSVQAGLWSGSGEEPIPDRSGRRAKRARSGVYGASFAKSRALLIGIGKAYAGNFTVLPNAVKDVAAVEQRLAAMPWEGWQVETLLDEQATRKTIRGKLRELGDEAGPDDRILVYFAGHGEPDDKSESLGWIIPSDGRTATAEPDRSSWVDMRGFHDMLSRTEAKHVLVALDCCYSGRAIPKRGGSPSALARSYLTKRAHVILSSARKNEQASDGERHSPFATTFVEQLDRRDADVLTATEILVASQKRLARTGQVPQIEYVEHQDGKPGGADFVFFLQDPK